MQISPHPLIDALRRWHRKPSEQFPDSAPPVGRIGHADQDRMLAALFLLLASADKLSDRIAAVLRAIERHKRHRQHELAFGHDTTATDALIERLRDWQEALGDEIGRTAA